MRKLFLYFGLIFFLVVSCQGVSGVKSDSNKQQMNDVHQETIQNQGENNFIQPISSDLKKVERTEQFKNGVSITWIEEGKGEVINEGEVVLIDFKVTLNDGRVIDGNHLLKKKMIPFMVGFNMQTKGWDFAFTKLKVGDYVNIKIPGNLARGEQGIKKDGESGWFVPPNSENFLTVKVIEKMKPVREIDGVKVWVFEENKNNQEIFGEGKAIVFHTMISTKSNPYYYNSYRERDPYTMYLTDKGIVPGLKKSLLGAKKADRMLVFVPANQGYGDKGLLGMVKPNEDLFYNILVLDVRDK